MSLLLDTVFLHLVEPILCLRAVSPLPQPLHIEVRCSSEVVFRRVPYFAVKERCIIACVVINLWAARAGIAYNIRLIVVTAVEQAIDIGISCAVDLLVRGQDIFIVS
jgi:hypothetical protein